MLKIYHAKGTRSVRVIWACEELSIDYQVVSVDWSLEHRQSESWRAMHPLGKVPVLEDGSLRITESAAMVQYILDRYGSGRLQPTPGTDEAARYLEWCWFAEASFARPLGDMVHHMLLKPEPERIPAVVADGRQRAALCLGHVERHMGNQHQQEQRFLLGNALSGADIVMAWSLHLAQVVKLLETSVYPHAAEYLETLEARPGCKVANGDFT